MRGLLETVGYRRNLAATIPSASASLHAGGAIGHVYDETGAFPPRKQGQNLHRSSTRETACEASCDLRASSRPPLRCVCEEVCGGGRGRAPGSHRTRTRTAWARSSRWRQHASTEDGVVGGRLADAAARERDELAASARASVLRLPLVWPEGTSSARAAMRVASLACERGRGGAFVLAASRLAFCGGFELDDPEVLAEAAAPADPPLS